MSFSPTFIVNQRDIQKIEPVKGINLDSTAAQIFTADVKKYKKIFIVSRSTHDADIDLRFRAVDNIHHKAWNGSAWEVNDTVILPKNDTAYFYINTALPYLNELVTDQLSIRVQALSVPTTGTLDIIVMGVIN